MKTDTPETDAMLESRRVNSDIPLEQWQIIPHGFVRKLERQRDALLVALEELFADYKGLADSGDAGNWSLEDQVCGKKALEAIAAVKGEQG